MSEITRGVIGMPFDMAMGSDLSRRQFHSRAQSLLAEIDRLRTAEGDAMTYKAGMENVAQQRDQLKAEVEAFKVANAELSEINVARRNHLSNAKKAAGIGPMDDLVGTIEALRKDAEHGRVAIRYIDRLCDPAECDPLETIVEEYVTAFSAVMSKQAARQ